MIWDNARARFEFLDPEDSPVMAELIARIASQLTEEHRLFEAARRERERKEDLKLLEGCATLKELCAYARALEGHDD